MEDTSTDLKMTHKFLAIFNSGFQVQVTQYLVGEIWLWEDTEVEDGPCYIVSPKFYSDYMKWKKSLPPLLLELV